MSAGDLNDLLNTPKLFLFLPGVNYMLLVGTVDQNNQLLLGIVALAASAITYNIIDGIPAEKAQEVSILTSLLFLLSGIVWIALFGISILRLKAAFSKQALLHEIMFFASVGFVFVVLSHIILLAEEEYKNIL